MKRLESAILFELDRDARQSFVEIGKEIGSSKQVVAYQFHLLVEKGIIKKFLTVFDLSKIGLILHKVYIRLSRTKEEDETQIVKYLEAHKNVAWLVRTEGVYDLAIALHTKDVLELNNVLNEIDNKFGMFISERIVNRVITGEFFHRDYLISDRKSEFRKPVVFETNTAPRELDEIDWQIIAGLSRDARMPVAQIAKHVPLTPDAVVKRVRSLEQGGVIKNYIVVLNDELLEQLHYKILMKVTHMSDHVERKFLEFCRQHPNITFYNKSIGAWEIEIDLEVKTSTEFRNVMRNIKREFADIIKEYFSLMIYDVVKFDFVPMKGLGKPHA